MMCCSQAGLPAIDWCPHTRAQAELGRRVITSPAGKVVGDDSHFASGKPGQASEDMTDADVKMGVDRHGKQPARYPWTPKLSDGGQVYERHDDSYGQGTGRAAFVPSAESVGIRE